MFQIEFNVTRRERLFIINNEEAMQSPDPGIKATTVNTRPGQGCAQFTPQ